MSDDYPRNIAVIGCGPWGKNLVRNLAELGALRWICDADLDRASGFAADHPPARATSDVDEVLADPEVAGVVIATPAVSHADIARAALAAGKHVYVEKPMAHTVDLGVDLLKRAKDADRLLMVGHILRYHPAVIKLLELVRAGELGEIQYIYSNRLNIGKIRTEENILWSFAPHDISVMRALTDADPISVACTGGSYLSQELADVTMSQFLFEGGIRAHIHVSWLHPFKEQRLVVIGSEKMAVFEDTAEKKLLLYPHKVEWNGSVPTAIKAEADEVPLEKAEPLKEECRHFLDCIASGAKPVTDGEEGLRVLRILDACQRSLELSGQPQTLELAHDG